MDETTVKLFNRTVINTFKDAKYIVRNTSLLPAAIRCIKYQREAVKKRRDWRQRGVHVPPAIILSATKRCNLRCAGCYHNSNKRENEDMSTEEMRSLFDEAMELGVSVIPIAGGEPLIRDDLIPALVEYPRILFPVFTNGLLIDESMARTLRAHRNIVPLVSLEGPQAETDMRRGKGVFNELVGRFELMTENDLFFGVSITVTSENYESVSGTEFINALCEMGVQVVVYVEYVPVDEGTEHLVLSGDQRHYVVQKTERMRKEKHALFINFPSDEEQFGGCLAAGRGFLHVSQDGSVEPCPASPYSDVNIKNMSLREALDSKLLALIRENPHSLEDSESGCALYDKREWVQSIIS